MTIDQAFESFLRNYCLSRLRPTTTAGYITNMRLHVLPFLGKRDLLIDCHEKYGWTITRPSDNLIQFCLDNDLSEILLNRDIDLLMGLRGIAGAGESDKASDGASPIAKVKKPSSTRKYQCPKCGMSVRATKEVNIICGDCREQLLPV